MKSFIITLFLISLSTSDSCPSNKFTFCANAGGDCYVPGGIKSGYISYGTSSLYILIPFTNSHSNDAVSMIFDCNEWLGYPGASNNCCYMSSDHDFELIDDSEWSFYHNEDNNIPWPGNKALTAWRWGGNIGNGGMYIYSVWSGFGPQNNRYWNAWMYPFNGLYSSWHTYSQLPTAVTLNSNWQYCANDGYTCEISGGPRWVRYGNDGGDWSYRFVTGTTLNCKDEIFKTRHTPWSSGHRYCQKGPVLTQRFSHIVGQWENCVICGGGCNTEINIKIGVTNHEESQLTDEWSNSLEVTASSSYSYGGFTGSVEVKNTISRALTESQISAWTKTTVKDVKVACVDSTDQKLCQFVTNINEEDAWGNSLDFDIKSQSYWCLSDDGLIPKCPPGYCADDDCQTCSESLTQ
eukprot:157095_1